MNKTETKNKKITILDMKWVFKEIENNILLHTKAKYPIVRILVIDKKSIEVQKEDNGMLTIYNIENGKLTQEYLGILKEIAEKNEILYKEINI